MKTEKAALAVFCVFWILTLWISVAVFGLTGFCCAALAGAAHICTMATRLKTERQPALARVKKDSRPR